MINPRVWSVTWVLTLAGTVVAVIAGHVYAAGKISARSSSCATTTITGTLISTIVIHRITTPCRRRQHRADHPRGPPPPHRQA
jgi:hypothetical protein